MICPLCDKALDGDDILMLTHDNKVTHCYWETEDQEWMDLHSSTPNQYTVAINDNHTI